MRRTIIGLAWLTCIGLVGSSIPLLGQSVEVTVTAAGSESAIPRAVAEEPSDTWGDAGVREVVLRAREVRNLQVKGLASYEATVRQAGRVSLRGPVFGRERDLWVEERMARVRWQEDGERSVVWLGAEREVPVAGRAEGGSRPDGASPPDEAVDGYVRDLLRSSGVGPLLDDPGGDRIAFGGNWALNPLADSAAAYYRFRSGDTLQVGFGGGTPIRLLEVRVEPRSRDYRLVSGSLWMDERTGGLVRATYRPARAFDLGLDGDGSPWWLGPVRAEIYQITVDHSLHDLEWWLPRRWGFEGEVRLGRLVRLPLQLEWGAEDYEVNEGPGVVIALLDSVPEGWSAGTRERPATESTPARRTRVAVVPRDSLVPGLGSGAGSAAGRGIFSEGELKALRGELETRFGSVLWEAPVLRFRDQRGALAFTSVEGVSGGMHASAPLGPWARARVEGRFSYPEGVVRWEGSLIRARAGGPEDRVSLYRRLTPSSDWYTGFGLGASLNALSFGSELTAYHEARGVEVVRESAGRGSWREVRLFSEEHRSVRQSTDFTLMGLIDGRVPTLPRPVQEGHTHGAAVRVAQQWGFDPDGWVVSGEVQGEAAWGDLRWQRGSAALRGMHPLPWRLIGGVELLAGVGSAGTPAQRQFFAGGRQTVRGLAEGALPATSFHLVRGELGRGSPAARLLVFGDGGAVAGGTAGRVRVASVGAGVSFLDGLLRLDWARTVAGPRGHRFHFYVGGAL